MATIVFEKRVGIVHKKHKHTHTGSAGVTLGYENYCFECGERLDEQGEWIIHRCSECGKPLVWIALITYRYCPGCGVKFD